MFIAAWDAELHSAPATLDRGWTVTALTDPSAFGMLHCSITVTFGTPMASVRKCTKPLPLQTDFGRAFWNAARAHHGSYADIESAGNLPERKARTS